MLSRRLVPAIAVAVLWGSVVLPAPPVSANGGDSARATSHSCSAAKRMYRHDVEFAKRVSMAEIAVAARTFKASKKGRADVLAYAAARQDSRQALRAALNMARSALARGC